MRMLRLCTLLLASSLLFPVLAQAQSALGTVRAFSVVGDVTLRNDTSGAEVPLTPGREFTEGFTIITGGGSSVTLVQSNGASIFLEENTSLSVNEFLQDPYNTAQGSYATLEEDPSPSSTRIKLNYGEITGNVKRLRPTSSYNVDLPIGSAGIRGTTYRAQLTFSTDPNTGETIMNAFFANADGDIIFDYDQTVTDIPQGNEIQIQGTFEEDFNPEEDDELPEGTFEFTGPQPLEDREVGEIVSRALRKLGQSEEEQEDQEGQPEEEEQEDQEGQSEEEQEDQEGQPEEEEAVGEEDDDTPDPDPDPNPDGNPEGDEDDFFEEVSPSNNEV